jgi:beta-lactamase superfamily II metal-dependent hydrolase
MAKQKNRFSQLFHQLKDKLKTWIEQLKQRFGDAHIKPISKRLKGPVRLYALPAHNGDSLLIEFVGIDKAWHYIWVDGGLVKSYREYGKGVMKQLASQGAKLDLLVVTHIDQDHIGGVLALVNDEEVPEGWIQQAWFNSGKLLSRYFQAPERTEREVSLEELEPSGVRSVAQGVRLESYLEKADIWHDTPLQAFHSHSIAGADLTLLAPSEKRLRRLHERWEKETTTSRSLDPNDYTLSIESLARRPEKEDGSIPNGSSLAFVMEYGDIRLLLLGDAPAAEIVSALKALGYSEEEPLIVSCTKLSHHGSRYSISNELLTLIDCDTFMLSTDGSRHQLPHKEALARIIAHPKRDPERLLTLIFNHHNDTLQRIFQPEEMERHHFRCVFPPEGTQGYMLEFP